MGLHASSAVLWSSETGNHAGGLHVQTADMHGRAVCVKFHQIKAFCFGNPCSGLILWGPVLC